MTALTIRENSEGEQAYVQDTLNRNQVWCVSGNNVRAPSLEYTAEEFSHNRTHCRLTQANTRGPEANSRHLSFACRHY